MKTKVAGKKLKAPDKLLKAMLEFVDYLKNNVKLYLILASIIIVVTAVVVLVNYFTNKKEENGRKTLYSISQQLQTLDKDKSEAAIRLIEENLSKLGNTTARLEAQYMLAEIYYNNKNWDKAINNYEVVTKKAKGLIKELALLGFAYSEENKGDIKEALNSFIKMKELNSSVYKDVAMMGIARCYQKLGDKNNALAAYESVIIAYPDSDMARLASAAKTDL
ncbi:MAG: tetratricopeptide repeat protein [Proteobacteria bacterium]|nr:tetratricopeptide repeat protein [Pseudomonadota bacterium]